MIVMKSKWKITHKNGHKIFELYETKFPILCSQKICQLKRASTVYSITIVLLIIIIINNIVVMIITITLKGDN